MQIIKLREEFIKLGQALKAVGFVESGVEAKDVIQNGLVLVNGEMKDIPPTWYTKLVEKENNKEYYGIKERKYGKGLGRRKNTIRCGGNDELFFTQIGRL